ncbi:MAG: hypothetical protein IAE77_01190 [Prosthecobacter sp.]|jgi:hypothetical protein|uniref:hypothetical protein n=1 Tax=Prosthecobacter sp. TaxID=1965333 RepID=UPI0019F62B75|nr:hypothetical protein [Prosthecobacter sp.]MBE2282055.1 hypothetical protein [Prosthecobacter sp.]
MKLALLFLNTLCLVAKAEDPATLMTTRGKRLACEDFAAAPAPFTGKPVGFASGFSGWRYNSSATGGKGGRWEIANGEFRGIETPGANHPATASLGMTFQDAIIQCEVRLNDVPDEGRKYRSLFVKATDAKDYVISLSLGQGGLFLTPYDADKINPATKQREKGSTVKLLKPIKLNEWHTVVLEIRGDEVVGTLDGQSITLSNSLIGAAKHSLMLGAGTDASFRKLRVWEALPNAAWEKNKAKLTAAAKP